MFRAGLDAEMFNRFKRGRTLDEASASGCTLLLEELALAVCKVVAQVRSRALQWDTWQPVDPKTR